MREDGGWKIRYKEEKQCTGCVWGANISKADEMRTPEEAEEIKTFPYWEAVGVLIWLATMTWLDIACAVRVVARFHAIPTPHKELGNHVRWAWPWTWTGSVHRFGLWGLPGYKTVGVWCSGNAGIQESRK